MRKRWYRAVALSVAAVVMALGLPPAAPAALQWSACPDADGWECARLPVPFDHGESGSQRSFSIAVTRLKASGPRAERRGTLFVNFGGPGAGAVEALHRFGADLFSGITARYDIIGFDPRGTGLSTPAIDCRVDQEFAGLYSKPFWTPENLSPGKWKSKSQTLADTCRKRNGETLRHVSTADVARDMDRIRAELGEAKLNYFGFSYGTFLGATYANLFPRNYRYMVLDGPVDPEQYANDPTAHLMSQSQGFEVALGRFFQACAAHQDRCGFGGDDPWMAFDELVERLTAEPAVLEDGRTLNGDDVLSGIVFITLYAKQNWQYAALGLRLAEEGDYSFLRFLADLSYGIEDDGTFSPFIDRYFTIGVADQDYSGRSVESFQYFGELAWELFPHTYFNVGYVELPYKYLGTLNEDRYAGPWRLPTGIVPPLVIGTTYDPATPYVNARKILRRLGNARLLTMRGDGHTAYGGNSRCIDDATNTFLLTGVLPKAGTVCRQEVPAFPADEARAVAAAPSWRPGGRSAAAR